MRPLISVITPCYNHGEYIDEAFDSIKLNKYSDIFEHIIINDGSTDIFTLKKFTELEGKGSIVIHQDNKGLAAARNTGIKKASGEFILLLDSDNKIIPEVFLEGLKMMEEDNTLDVFHTYGFFFGEKEGIWQLGPFDLERMFSENHIDACALIRKSTLEKVGSYSTDMPVMGHEDWELWIKIGIQKGKFHLYPVPGFFYRVRRNSMVNLESTPQADKTFDYIFKKHYHTIASHYSFLFYKYSNRQRLFREKIEYIEKNRFRSIVKLILGRSLS